MELKEGFDEPARELFIWSVLNHQFDMAMIFWKEGKVSKLNTTSFLFSSAVPSGSGGFQMPTRPSSAAASSAASTLRRGMANIRNASATFFLFILAWSFLGMTLTTYHKKDFLESL